MLAPQAVSQLYNYYRSYSPNNGGYTQPDPIGLKGGWNRFGYVQANPLRFTDPRGLDDICTGTDCSKPPFDLTADGPKPGGPQSKPGNRNDNTAAGTLCERFEDRPITKWICEKCVSAACSAGIVSSAMCCGEAHRQCVVKEKSEGRDGAECAAQLMTCNAFGGRGSR